MLCDTKLKEISRSWDQDTWDRFLKDTVEGCQRDLLVKDFDRLINKRLGKQAIHEFWVEDQEEPEHVKTALECRVEQLVWRLPPKEGEVIKHLFYENLSPRQAARKMKVSHTWVQQLRNAAIERLRAQLKADGYTKW